MSGLYCPDLHYNNKLFSECRQSLSDPYKLSSWDKYVLLSLVLLQVTFKWERSIYHFAMQDVPKLSDVFGANDKNITSKV